jgi:CBS domain-containing protein
MHVKAILEDKGRTIIAAQPRDTVAQVAEQLAKHRIGAVVVLDEAGGLDGIVSERDIVRALAKHGDRVTTMSAAELMTHPVRSCRPDDTVDQLMQVMTRHRIRHLPVVEEGRMIGMVSIGDVVKHKLELSEMEVDSLRQYVLEAR